MKSLRERYNELLLEIHALRKRIAELERLSENEKRETLSEPLLEETLDLGN